VTGQMLDRTAETIASLVVETSHDGIWVVDVEGNTLYANDRAAELIGRAPGGLTGLNVLDTLDATGRDQFRTHLREASERGANQHDVECQYRTPAGELVRLMVGESELRDESGELIGFVHRMIGDSQRLKMLDEIRRGQSQLANAQSIARMGSWEIDTTQSSVTWSPMIYEVLGLDPERTVPSLDTFFSMLHDADRRAVEHEYETAQRGPGERTIDARLLRGDGTTRWVRIIGRTLEWTPDGEPLRIGGTVQDIDRAKETELKLRDAVVLNTLMQFMASAANQASTLHDAMGTLRELLLGHGDWQAAVAFEVRGDDVVPINVTDSDEHTELERQTALKVLRAGTVVFEEDAAPENPLLAFPVCLDGKPLIIGVTTARSPFERQPMLLAMATQVAAQLETVAAREAVSVELAAARDHAMEASRAKSEFVATMSHEIRTPLNGVIGLNDLLLRTGLDDQQRRLAQGVQSAGRGLLRLINDILDFSKIEAGALDLERVPFRPHDIVSEVLQLAEPEAGQRDNRLTATLADSVPGVVVGDPGRFHQVLSNLVSNAVKFTADGQVEVVVQADAVAAGDRDQPVVELRVEVRDTGIGMSAGQLERVFDPFRQADASTTRDYGGTGLGLTIARQLAAALGGELGATSTLGAGSTFWFTSRFEAFGEVDEPMPPARPVESTLAGLHVLVVEDNEVNQLVGLGMLEALGCTADVAPDGAEGAERALTGAYDAVLMDLQMPGTDGFAGTRLIREGQPEGRHLPVIALTASATDEDRRKCAAAGMDGFLTKPLSFDRLAAELRRCVNGESPRLVPVAATEAPGERVLDCSRLDELAEMGPDAAPLIIRAVDNFVDRTGDDVAELRSAVERRDGDALRLTAHRVKGSAANLGLLEIAAVAYTLEELGRSGIDDGTPAPELLSRLEVALDTGIDALRRHPLLSA
jgi:PAS domain S-box-containing protein